MSWGDKDKREEKPLRNTVRIAEGEGGDKEFTVCPEGSQALGLVKIKNVQFDRGYGLTNGYRFIFRAKAHPEAFVCYECSDAVGKNSNLYKLMLGMSGGQLTQEVAHDADAFFNFMQRMKDKWFQATIEHQPWKAPDGTEVVFTKIQNNFIMPHPEGKGWPPAAEFFRGDATKKQLASPSEKVDFDSPAPKAEKTEAIKTPVIHNLPKYMYDIKFSDVPKTRESQIAFIKANAGVINPLTGIYHFSSKVKELEKKFIGEFLPEALETKPVSFDDDELPWE